MQSILCMDGTTFVIPKEQAENWFADFKNNDKYYAPLVSDHLKLLIAYNQGYELKPNELEKQVLKKYTKYTDIIEDPKKRAYVANQKVKRVRQLIGKFVIHWWNRKTTKVIKQEAMEQFMQFLDELGKNYEVSFINFFNWSDAKLKTIEEASAGFLDALVEQLEKLFQDL